MESNDNFNENSYENSNNNDVILGFAEEVENGDLEIENFPSKLGGFPIWLVPLKNNISLDFFKCSCGKFLSFLLQLYCPLEKKKNCFHRMIYVFYCNKCWKYKNFVKVLRLNLPENSNYFKGENILNKSLILNDPLINELNKILKNQTEILDEFFITTSIEKKEASKIYFNFYNNIEEKSIKSNDSFNNNNNNNFDFFDEDLISIKNKNELNEINNLTKEYLNNNPNFNIEKIEEESFDEKENDKLLNINNDFFYDIFSNVVEYDQQQIIRYYRNNFFPLWFTKNNILTVNNIKCKNCAGNVEFEFQIMPYIFLIEEKIAKNDIGTIVVYTCKNCCNNNNKKIEGGFVQEYGFIQRTGENFRDFKDNDNIKNNNKNNNDNNNNNVYFDDDDNKEIKKKKKNKKKKVKNDDENDKIEEEEFI